MTTANTTVTAVGTSITTTITIEKKVNARGAIRKEHLILLGRGTHQ